MNNEPSIQETLPAIDTDQAAEFDRLLPMLNGIKRNEVLADASRGNDMATEALQSEIQHTQEGEAQLQEFDSASRTSTKKEEELAHEQEMQEAESIDFNS